MASAAVTQSHCAPTPDYASGLAPEVGPEVERCSCDEALALRAEVARLTADNADYEQRWLKAERDCGAAEARCRVLQANWDACHEQHRGAEVRLDRARKILMEGRPVDSPESRLAHDLREILGE
jgi:hypothetical protein